MTQRTDTSLGPPSHRSFAALSVASAHGPAQGSRPRSSRLWRRRRLMIAPDLAHRAVAQRDFHQTGPFRVPGDTEISGGNLAEHEMQATGTSTSSTTRFPPVADRAWRSSMRSPDGLAEPIAEQSQPIGRPRLARFDRRIFGGLGGGPSTGPGHCDQFFRCYASPQVHAELTNFLTTRGHHPTAALDWFLDTLGFAALRGYTPKRTATVATVQPQLGPKPVRQIPVIVATPEVFGSCDGWQGSAGFGTADGQA